MAEISRIVRSTPLGGFEAPQEPCARCGVRADVGCRHRPATGVAPTTIVRNEKEKVRPPQMRPGGGQGLHFNPGRIASNMERAKAALKPVNRNEG